MRLFYHPGTCALAPHIILAEGGFAGYRLERVSRLDLALGEWPRLAACIERVASRPLLAGTLEQEEG